MPLSHQEKIKIAKEYIEKYYSSATGYEKQNILTLSVKHFVNNYSPIKKEQESSHALGSGLTFEEFVIHMGWLNTENKWPKGIERENLAEILRKGLM